MLKHTTQASAPKPDNDYEGLVLKIRLGLGGVLATAIAFPSIYQPLLTAVWDYLKSTSWYNWSTYETLWTVFCYAAIEPYVTTIFMQNPQWRFAEQKPRRAASSATTNSTNDAAPSKNRSKPKGMRRPTRRVLEGLTYVLPLLTLDLTMIKKFAGVSLESKLISGNYDPNLPTYQSGHFMLPSVHNFSRDSPLQIQRAIPDFAPSSRRLALELVASFVIYDAMFFLFHLALHILPGLKIWHAPHHTHHEIHPQITNQLSIFERLGLVLLANFSLNIIGAHVLTRTLFVPVFVWLLVEIHCGLDLPWGYDKILPKGWAGGARKHALHHASGRGGLEPFFSWCDGAMDGLLSLWRTNT